MKFSGKMYLMIILKVTKKQGFTLSLEDTFFKKTQEGWGWGAGGVKLTPLSHFRVKISWPTQESKHIIYLDTNNLYGYAMSRFFPTSGFKWIDPKEFNLNKYTSNSSKGFVLEVDLEYPKKLRELHNNYPLAQKKSCLCIN